MPYIPEKDRFLAEVSPVDAGELNFYYTKIIDKLWKANTRYATVHEIKKTLNTMPQEIFPGFDKEDHKVAKELAFMEFYRRVVVPYENTKLAQNGDVYN